MIICAGQIDLRSAQKKMATDWVALYNEMNDRMLHDPELRSALLGPAKEINPDFKTGGRSAPPDDEGLNAAQWQWVAKNQCPLASP